MINVILALLLVVNFTVYAENTACERLIDCLEKVRAKNEQCFSNHPNKTTTDCYNETLHQELKDLINQRTTYFETCLKDKLLEAGEIVNVKKKKKCETLLQRTTRNLLFEDETATSGAKKKVKKQSCYKEARKLKTQCSQLARCCTVSKLCRDTSVTDSKIYDKREHIRKSSQKCKKEKRRRKKDRKHRISGQQKKAKLMQNTEFQLL